MLYVIVATAVLYNLAIDMNDNEPDYAGDNDVHEGDNEDGEIRGNNGHIVRQDLINNYFANL